MTLRYLSIASLKTYLRDEIPADDSLYEEACEQAELYLDLECGRRFVVADSVASARTYAPTLGSPILRIHDCTEITSVVESSTTLTVNTDYIHSPHQVTRAGELRPIDTLTRVYQSWYADGPKRTVTVTAKWGWAAIPVGAKAAGKIAAKAYLESRDVRLGLAALTESGGVRETEAKMVRDFIANYGRSVIGVAG